MSQNRNMTDEELDALFKGADQEMAVPAFNDAYWTEMEAMLPQQKRRGGIIFFWSSGAALVAGLLVFLGWNYATDDVRLIAFEGIESSMNYVSVPKSTVPVNDNVASYEVEQESMQQTSVVSPTITNPASDKKKPVAEEDFADKNMQKQRIEAKLKMDQLLGQFPIVVEEVKETTVTLNSKRINYTQPVNLNDVDPHTSRGFSIPVYTEFGVGYGQSYKRIEFTNNWATQFRFAVGLMKEVPGLNLNAGLAFRAELPNNLTSVENTMNQNNSESYKTVGEYRGLYSVEFPMEAAARFKRGSLGLFVVPGIQLGYTGNKAYYKNEVFVSREHQTGKFADAKTMTMEFGLKYAYSISEKVQFTTSCTFDMVRPFQSAIYQGDNQDYPVTFFVGLRRKF